MIKKSKSPQLLVYMNNIYVGKLIRKTSRNLEFTYDESWLQKKNARPISLSLPLREKKYVGDVISNFLDNLLPDNGKILERIQRKFGAESQRGFDLLYHIGKDCVGALELLTQPISKKPEEVSGDKLHDTVIANKLRDYRNEPLGMSGESDFRIS